MGDYYGCAFRILAVFHQYIIKSLNLNPYMSLFNLKLCTHIWSTNINFRPSLTLDFLVHLGLNFHPMGEFWGRDGESIGPPIIFCHGQKRDYLSLASQCARGATKSMHKQVIIYTKQQILDRCILYLCILYLLLVNENNNIMYLF